MRAPRDEGVLSSPSHVAVGVRLEPRRNVDPFAGGDLTPHGSGYVKGFGCRPYQGWSRRHGGPASESLQGRKPREWVRGAVWRALWGFERRARCGGLQAVWCNKL